MKKSLILLILLFNISTADLWAQWTGTGTTGDPYLITDTTGLAELSRKVYNGTNYAGKYFKLTADLDLSDWDSGDGKGWKEIGTYISWADIRPFKGIFDGNNHKINGLKTDDPTMYKQAGLFGYIEQSKISNLKLENVNIKGDQAIGGLAGNAFSTSFENCSVKGIFNVNFNTGGLVGNSSGCSFVNCYANVTIDGYGTFGGLVGTTINTGATFTDCYAISNITGVFSALGGLIGENRGSSSTITRCYAICDIKSVNPSFYGGAGGLIGNSYGTTVITNSYAIENITAPQYTGGLIGQVGYANTSITNCYAEGDVHGNNYLGGLIGGLTGNASQTTTITNAYAKVNLDGTYMVGGLVGWNDGQVPLTITNSAATGSSINASPAFRILGEMNTNIILSNDYANESMLVNGCLVPPTDPNVGNNKIHGADQPLTILQSAPFYTDATNNIWKNNIPWDLNSTTDLTKIWNIWENKSFPYFQWQSAPASIIAAEALNTDTLLVGKTLSLRSHH